MSQSPELPHVLVMDDDLVIRTEIARTLEELGLAVTSCDTATEAKAIWQSGQFDMVISDIFVKMGDDFIPDGGVSLLGWLQTRTDVPIIAITGHPRQHLEEMKILGAAVCLEKPLSMKQLATQVTRLLKLKTHSA